MLLPSYLTLTNDSWPLNLHKDLNEYTGKIIPNDLNLTPNPNTWPWHLTLKTDLYTLNSKSSIKILATNWKFENVKKVTEKAERAINKGR